MAQGIGSGEGAPAPASLPKIPRYELLDRLGEGGMGEVFLARHLSLDREVAVELVRRELLAEEWFLERLEREARLLARLRHPHLVTVHDFLRSPDGTATVVMVWVGAAR
jgi:serine/threonine protein kinase